VTQSLLDKIIESGTANEPPPLSSVLRQCILLPDQWKVPLLRTWAERELTGYPNPKDVPEYRIVNVGAYGNFAGVGVRYQARPIPAGLLKPEHRWAATVHRLTEPVSAYESLDGSSKGALIYDWPSDMIAYYQSRLLERCVLMTAWQQVPKSVFAGVLDTIRTRVLTMAIDIKNDSERSGVDLTRIKEDSPEADKVQQTVVHSVYGNVYVAAGNQVINTQNIEVGNWDDLHKLLKEFGIDEANLGQLHDTLQHDKKMDSRGLKDWISRNAGKVFDHGLQVGTTVGTTILTQLIKRHLGMPP
jgi:AbiTii